MLGYLLRHHVLHPIITVVIAFPIVAVIVVYSGRTTSGTGARGGTGALRFCLLVLVTGSPELEGSCDWGGTCGEEGPWA